MTHTTFTTDFSSVPGSEGHPQPKSISSFLVKHRIAHDEREAGMFLLVVSAIFVLVSVYLLAISVPSEPLPERLDAEATRL